MDISKLTIGPKLTPESSVTPVLKNLQPGQQLQANVLSDTSQNLVKLKIGTTEFIARTQVSLRAEQNITLNVIKAGNMPELRLVREAEIRNFQSDVLRSILPKQLPMQRLYANLQAVYNDIMRSLPQPGADQRVQQAGLPQQTISPKAGTTDNLSKSFLKSKGLSVDFSLWEIPIGNYLLYRKSVFHLRFRLAIKK